MIGRVGGWRSSTEIVLSGRTADNHMMFLWQVLNLELWLRSLPA